MLISIVRAFYGSGWSDSTPMQNIGSSRSFQATSADENLGRWDHKTTQLNLNSDRRGQVYMGLRNFYIRGAYIKLLGALLSILIWASGCKKADLCAVCSQHMRQLGYAFKFYLQDNNHALPLVIREDDWVTAIEPYLLKDVRKKLLHCPLSYDRNQDGRIKQEELDLLQTLTDYFFNPTLSGRDVSQIDDKTIPLLLEKRRKVHRGSRYILLLNGTVAREDQWKKEKRREIKDGCSPIAELKDRDSRVRWEGAGALGEIGDSRAVQPLIATLKDENWLVRVETAKALGKIGDSRAVPPLIATLKDKNKMVRVWAAAALYQLNYERGKQIGRLISALKEKHWGVRLCAVRALGQLKDLRAVEPLTAVLDDPLFQEPVKEALELITGKNPDQPRNTRDQAFKLEF